MVTFNTRWAETPGYKPFTLPAPLQVQLELRRRFGDEYHPEPVPHLREGRQPYRRAHSQGQLKPGQEHHSERDHHGVAPPRYRPGGPTKVTATAGNGKITLNWVAPSSDGGEAITAYEVFRGTSSGTETYLTSGGCSNLGAVLTCTDTGLKNGTKYYYYLIAANSIGTGPQSNETSATPTATTGPWCTASSAPANDGHSGDYNVSIKSTQPGIKATASDATDSYSGTTNSAGSVTILLYYQKAEEKVTVTVGTATCTTNA